MLKKSYYKILLILSGGCLASCSGGGTGLAGGSSGSSPNSGSSGGQTNSSSQTSSTFTINLAVKNSNSSNYTLNTSSANITITCKDTSETFAFSNFNFGNTIDVKNGNNCYAIVESFTLDLTGETFTATQSPYTKATAGKKANQTGTYLGSKGSICTLTTSSFGVITPTGDPSITSTEITLYYSPRIITTATYVIPLQGIVIP